MSRPAGLAGTAQTSLAWHRTGRVIAPTRITAPVARLFCHLVGQPAGLARFELHSVLAAEGCSFAEELWQPPLVVLEPDAVPARPVLERLAFTHEVTQSLGTADLRDAVGLAALPRVGLAAGSSFVVRATRLTPGPEDGLRAMEVERTLGAAWSDAEHRVDLTTADQTVRAYLVGDAVFVGIPLWTSRGHAFEERAARHRPYFSPVSGHPRWMRAVVNCAGVPRGGVLYDPVCGTGGTLIEAASAGLRAVGSDVDPAMVEGTTTNLAHFGLQPEQAFVADVRDAPRAFADQTGLDHADGVVADLPYGQSASTRGATPRDVAGWTLRSCVQLLRPGHRAVVGTSDPSILEPVPAGLRIIGHFQNRVHKTMTRHYVVFERTDV